jgi:predicted nucleic acid-binding protein
MVVLIDTNVILDHLIKREPFAAVACKILQKCYKKEISGFFAGHTIPDIFYILRKEYTTAERKEMLLGVCEIMNVVGIDQEKLVAALTSRDIDDVEDCLQAECAKAAGAKYIITRNIRHFVNSAVPAILPEVFLEKVE